MKNIFVRRLAVVLAVIVTLSAAVSVCASSEYPEREGDYTLSPRDGSIVVGIEGTFAAVDETAKNTLLARVNEIRKEACDEGVPYPGDRTRNLTSSDYVPLKWSGLVELVAAMRAVEASMCIAHKRLAKDHTSVFDNNYGVSTHGENLAWNWEDATVDAILFGIEQWYGEKADWLADTPGAVTGHYTSMINPAMKYIGLSGFVNPDPGAQFRTTVTNQLSMSDGLDENVAGIGGKVTQKIEVDPDLVEKITVTGNGFVSAGNTDVLTARATVTVTEGTYTSSGSGPVYTGITWSSGDTSIATVDSNGVVTGVSEGETTITAALANGTSGSVTVTVRPAAAYSDVNLKFTAASVTLNSDLSLNFKTDNQYYVDAGYDSVYCMFRVNGVDHKVTGKRILDGKIVFTYRDIAPDRMNDVVTATVYAVKNGDVYEGKTASRSVSQYCYNMLNVSGSAYLKTLLVDLLNYGSESQKYTGYQTGALANAKLTSAQRAFGSSGAVSFGSCANTAAATVSSPTVSWESAGLSLYNSVCIRYKLSTTETDIAALTVQITDNDGRNWSFAGTAFVATEGGYYLYFDRLGAEQMRKPVYATVYKNGAAVSNTMSYSVESYVYATYSQNNADPLLPLLVSMLYYGDSAAAYVQNR